MPVLSPKSDHPAMAGGRLPPHVPREPESSCRSGLPLDLETQSGKEDDTMDRNLEDLPREVLTVLRRELIRLAKLEDDRAADEAARVPYWSPCPSSVEGHRAAALALRRDADAIDGATDAFTGFDDAA